MRVLVFGDSIAQGFYDRAGGWVNRLREYYDTVAIGSGDQSQPTVFNLGVSGNTTKDLLRRLENETLARAYPGEAVAFVIAIGTNDSLYRNNDNDSEPEDFQEELNKTLDIVRKYSDKILFVGLFPVVDGLLQPIPWSSTGKCYSTVRMKLFNRVLESFCQEHKLPFVDLWSVLSISLTLKRYFTMGFTPIQKGTNSLPKPSNQNSRSV